MARLPGPARAGVLGYFTNHPTAANLLLVVLCALGLAAAVQMRAQSLPDIVLDDITVTVAWDGAGPEAVDAAIVAPLLPALREVDGVRETDAEATEGRARISLEFAANHDMDRARDAVERAVRGVTDLPEDAERAEVTHRAWTDRVTDVVITGPVGVDQLARFADDFARRLFEAGVTRTTISGVAGPETRVRVPTRALIRHDLTLAEIAEAVGRAAADAPAGTLAAADARLRSGIPARSPDAIRDVVLRHSPDGTALTVGDVAEITRAGVAREAAYYVGDNPAVHIRVARSADGDAIALQRAVEEAAAAYAAELPAEVRIDLIRTRSQAISERLSILLDNGLVGFGLVLALLFLFLNARTALWVAAGIPVAMLTAVALMYAAGLTLNMVSLFGLIITLGIVVDDAIVVGEHADFRARRLGEAPALAAENAARRMALPVFSATITTIIAFFALTAIGGRFGALIYDIPVTVIAVLAASLVECFLILPHHMKHALTHTARAHWYDWPSRQANWGFRWARERLFRPLVHLVLRARYPVIAGAIAVLASQVAQVISGEVAWRFWNAPERGSVTVSFAMRDTATRADTRAQMREVQRAVAAVRARLAEAHGRDPVDYALAQVGGASGRGLTVSDDKDRDLLGSVDVELIAADARPYSSYDFVARLRDEVRDLPQTAELSYQRWRGGPGGDALDVDLYGGAPETLKAAAEALKRAVAVYPEVATLSDDMPWDKTQLTVTPTAQAQVLGFTAEGIGQVLRDRLDGIEAARHADGRRTATIRVELPEAEKTADFLRRTLIRAPSGQYLPLGDLVTVTEEPGFARIQRADGVRTVTVTGDIDQSDPQRAEAIMQALRTEILPRIESEYGTGWRLSGLAEQERAFLGDAAVGFALCLLGIFLTLAWIFASWTRPLAIMAIIPFGVTGVIWGHHVWEVPMSIFTVVGLIGMTGILINDSIVLISTIDEYGQRRGLFPAIADAVCDRLRPVLLTTLTTVLGLTPLLYETSQQAQFLKPTVITLVYGLGFGLALVLVVVPALLAAGHDAARAARAARRALRAPRRAGIRGPVLTLAGLLALWGAATIGAQIVLGRPLLGLPGAGMGAAMAAFAAGAVALTLATYAVAAGRAATRPSPGPAAARLQRGGPAE